MKISNKLFLYILILIVLLLAVFGYISVQDERRHGGIVEKSQLDPADVLLLP